MSFKVSDRVTWVGKIDWDLQKFHGDEYSTHKGSSYNSYLIRDEKIALIDTVWRPFAREFVDGLKREVELDKIDYIIINHSEVDHSGALIELMKEIPDTPIYCTKTCAKYLKAHYNKEWNFVEVKTGDSLELGKTKLEFIEAKMLHWPDTMFTYLTEDNILFSSDAFGQHYASEEMFDSKVSKEEAYYEAIKYYTNILTPFNVQVKRKVKEILDLNLKIDMICTAHGIIWKENVEDIINSYLKWSDNYQEDQITILYDTMWDSTKIMAENIAKGLKDTNKDTKVKILNTSKYDKNDVVTEVFKSKAILVGSSTINKGILYSIAGILEMIKGLGFKNKKAAAFGSFGWSGECVKIINHELEKAGFELISEGVKQEWVPNETDLAKCKEFGRNFGISI